MPVTQGILPLDLPVPRKRLCLPGPGAPGRFGMKLLFLGDVMGRAGRQAVGERLPRVRSEWGLDFVVVNGENASNGAGLTAAHAKLLFEAGADVVTLGDHAFDQKDMLQAVESESRILRPLNYARTAPGRGAALFADRRGRRVLVAQALGQVFMKRAFDDPFSAWTVRCGGWAGRRRPLSWTCIARRRRRRWPWAISATAAPASWSARTPMCPRPTRNCCPAAPAT